MKKRWIEVSRGQIVELTSVRSVSAGLTNGSMEEGNCLYVKYVGERTPKTLSFSSVEEKWKAYDVLKEFLTTLKG